MNLQCDCYKFTIWGKFKEWFFNIQWRFWIASGASVIINGLFLKHSGWSGYEQIIEGFCAGVIIGLVYGSLLYDK